MRFVKFVAIALSLIAIVTGAMDIVMGVSGQVNIGVGVPAHAPYDPVLDSQVRFLGAVWLGIGIVQWVSIRDPGRYATMLQLCFAAVILGGVGRALSLIMVGLPPRGTGLGFVVVALLIELLLVPVAWLALRRALALDNKGARP